jgi:hypothetical protein
LRAADAGRAPCAVPALRIGAHATALPMHLTIKAAGALLPAALARELGSALQVPALARLLADADAGTTSQQGNPDGTADDRWLAREVYATAGHAPTAPYAWAALRSQADRAVTLWHAEPIHVAIGRESLIVHALGAPPDEDEAAALVAAANEVLAADGCRMHRAGTSWFLHASGQRRWHSPPIAAAHGRPLPVAALDDADALEWSRLHNALQMRWHDDPVNRSREERGLPPINALWLHGSGAWKRLPSLRWTALHSDRPEQQGAAAAAGARHAPALAPVAADTLVEWDDARRLDGQFDPQRWLAAMQAMDARLAALPAHATVELVLIGQHDARSFVARPTTGWRSWRRVFAPRSPAALLAAALAEAPAA